MQDIRGISGKSIAFHMHLYSSIVFPVLDRIRYQFTSILYFDQIPKVSQLCTRAASVVFVSRYPFVLRYTLRIRTLLVTISNTMSSTISATAKTILKGPTDWIQWLEMVKSTATTSQVWVYVDPSKTDAQLPLLVEPIWPKPGNLACT